MNLCVLASKPMVLQYIPSEHRQNVTNIQSIMTTALGILTHYCLTATIVTVLSKFRFQKRRDQEKKFL